MRLNARGGLLICLLLLSAQYGVAQLARTATIAGSAPQYAGVELRWMRPADALSGTKRLAGTVTPDKKGDFTLQLSLESPQLLTLEVGRYLCYLYAEPGGKYRITLPPLEEKEEADRLNPYFEPIEVHLQSIPLDSLQTNFRIARFDEELERALDSVTLATDSLAMRVNLRAMASRLAGFDTLNNTPFLRDYKFYRMGLFGFLSGSMKVQALSDRYFKRKRPLYDNPAYTDLFAIVYQRYFVYHGRTKEGRSINQAISDGSYSRLKSILQQNDNLAQDSLMELVILKNLHDEFYNDTYSRAGLTQILDSLCQQTKISEHRAIALNIQNKVNRLLKGHEPSPFSLPDQDGVVRTMADYKGRVILLCFCTTSSYTCIQDFALLARLQRQFGERLQIVAICADIRYESMVHYAQTSGYKWPFVYCGGDPRVVADYDVRSYPTYYLVDPEGKLLLSPAPGPQEGLGRVLFEQWRARGWSVEGNNQ